MSLSAAVQHGVSDIMLSPQGAPEGKNIHHSQDTQPPLTPRQGLDYRGTVPDASP